MSCIRSRISRDADETLSALWQSASSQTSVPRHGAATDGQRGVMISCSRSVALSIHQIRSSSTECHITGHQKSRLVEGRYAETTTDLGTDRII